jgi:hypothetical protein
MSDLRVVDYGLGIPKPGCDTTPVVLIYMTTTRLFAAAPEYRYELALVEGWLIQCFDGEMLFTGKVYEDFTGISKMLVCNCDCLFSLWRGSGSFSLFECGDVGS